MIWISKFAWNIREVSMQKENWSELAWLELHLNFLFLGIQLYCVPCFLFAKLGIFKL